MPATSSCACHVIHACRVIQYLPRQPCLPRHPPLRKPSFPGFNGIEPASNHNFDYMLFNYSALILHAWPCLAVWWDYEKPFFAGQVAGLCQQCLPRHQPHCRPSFLEFKTEIDASACIRRHQAFALAPVSSSHTMTYINMASMIRLALRGGSVQLPQGGAPRGVRRRWGGVDDACPASHVNHHILSPRSLGQMSWGS